MKEKKLREERENCRRKNRCIVEFTRLQHSGEKRYQFREKVRKWDETRLLGYRREGFVEER